MASVDIPLEGKIILITGGASGIGLSLAKQSYNQRARVLVADIRSTPDLDTFAEGKDSVLYVPCDVTKFSELRKALDACEEKWNDVPDAYGICAGLFEPSFSNFWLDPEDEGYKQVEVNVSHPIKLTRLAMTKSLGRGKRASVCIISSIGGIAGNIAAPLYCATKHAVVGFVKSLKDSEPITGVKVTAICPAVVNTPLFTPEKQSQFSYHASKALSPETVAEHMTQLIQEKRYGCGTVLELSLKGSRVIPEWNIPPPDGEGTGAEFDMEAFTKAMLKPIVEKLDTERGTGAKL